jgi:electron transport complex protein RnfB
LRIYEICVTLADALNISSPAIPDVNDSKTLADRIEDLLPQTQCTKCGYDGCRPYAEAVASGAACHNQCPPGGIEGVARLAALLGKPVLPVSAEHGRERPRPLAVIEENLCIGCTLCLQACPVDAIVGAPKQMHTVIPELCTGCDLCVAPCPVDCIAMVAVTGNATGWDAWTQDQANAAREHHDRRLARLARERDAAEQRVAARHAALAGAEDMQSDHDLDAGVPAHAADPRAGATGPAGAGTSSGGAAPAPVAAENDAEAKKRAIIQAALERARKKKEEMSAQGAGPKNTANLSTNVQAQIDAANARRERLGVDAPPRPRDAADDPDLNEQ